MNSATRKEHPIQLEEVQQQFTAWRATRQRNAPIPEALWQQVFLLLHHYPRTQVLRTLGLKRERLTAKLTPAAPEKPATLPDPGFLAIPLNPLATTTLCHLEFSFAQTCHLTLQVPWPQVLPLLQALLPKA